ncbi:hypothetical protein [Methylocystis echinoides]|uniref:hypothetical protein n=1 Tax=Methylocystis echinoides TaxID=29468 RepID=UPI00342C7718
MPQEVSICTRSGQSLREQFVYIYGFSAEDRIICALVRFTDQHVFEIIAAGSEATTRIEAQLGSTEEGAAAYFKAKCSLKHVPDGLI